ncbi:hypothetical protein [Domibacillus epiphyticus]|uniref:Uncharacterized protein n=1 Tax=Domibacillus epiphyticus TaxID=1714355 RepID=A0A1V2A4X3_9BACI|nr:hypothetical protein [Domibacillus epiphyticus]OMP65990.1 hypothetical protein BTO28_14460 [Domibacillus epiphyticus]
MIFQNFQAQHIPRTAKVQRNARTWGEMLHADDELILLRGTTFQARTLDDFTGTDFLYGYHKKLVK